MGIKAYAAGLCVAVIAATAFAVPSVEAQTSQTKKKYVSTTTRVAASRPRARIVVAPRSFLDAGTEVKPGERKFTDYAFPPGNAGLGIRAVTNTGGRVGWDTNPFMTGPELGGFNRW